MSVLDIIDDAVFVPIPKGEKGPRLKGWQKLTLDDMTPDFRAGLNHGSNIGVLMGEPSGGLCSVDCDDDVLLDQFLSLNPALGGTLISRGARGGNVWLRIIGEYPKAAKLKTDAGEAFGEWRATGNQTVIHGTHPSGCEYRNNGNPPLAIAFDEIQWPGNLGLPWMPEPDRIIPDDHHALTANDAGRAERFVLRYVDQVRFVPDRGCWMTWRNRWSIDRDGGRERLAIDLSREMLTHAAQIPGTDDAAAKARSNAVREAMACGDRRNIGDYLGLAQVHEKILCPTEKLDADPWIAGTQNAVIELKTGMVREYARTDYLTKTLGIESDPAAACPRWEQFMVEVFPDPEVRHYVWKAAGYSLTGDMREQVFFFCYGTGRNGKSKFIETLETVFGSLAVRAGKGIISANQRGDYPLREIADLAGARMILTSETEEGERLNEGVIKDLTGGDSLRGEHKFERAFTFKPTGKLWIIGNHRPTIKGTDGGIWRRVRLIPFTQKFEGAADDRSLGDKLRAEASGIANWLVQGALLWQREGLEPPNAIRAAVDEYRAEEDTLADFIDDCTTQEQESATSHAALFESYRRWATDSGIRYQLTSRLLAKRLRERGLQDMRTPSVRCLWRGIKLGA